MGASSGRILPLNRWWRSGNDATLDLPDELVDDARKVLGFKSKTDTVVYALREVVRRRHVEGVKALFGKVHIDLDLDKVRGRKSARA